MAKLQFFKETSQPTTWEADAFYFITSTGPTGGLFAESFITDSAGTPRMIGNTNMIIEIANSLSMAELEIAPDITSRDALTLSVNSLVLVTDASGDATVNGGAAMYFYDQANDNYVKVTEFESLDVVLDWANIQNKPASTVAQIDQAVTDSHTHPNKTELDKIGEDANGCMTYDGQVPQSWSTTNW